MTTAHALRTTTFLVLAWLVCWPALLARPAEAAGACAPHEGVTVVVDFAAFGGGVELGCAPGRPDSGLEAMVAAGFDITPVQSSPGFVCRIDGHPTPVDEDCTDTPPASAFWAFWTAQEGGSWKLSQLGAGAALSTDFIGWSFAVGTATAPRFAIPPTTATTSAPSTTTTSVTTAKPSTTTSPPTTTTSPTTSTSHPTTTTPYPTTTTSHPTTTTSYPTTTSTTNAGSTSTSTSSTRPTTTSTSRPSTTPLGNGSAAASGGGSPAPALVGVGLIVAGGAGALWFARRGGGPG